MKTLQELKDKVQEYQYMEDTGILTACVASAIGNLAKFGSPIWLMVVGRSSGGKSQIIRPLAKCNTKFFELDDITENTFLSGAKSKKLESEGIENTNSSNSLLIRLGKHIVFFLSDMTVLMSKKGDSRDAVISQTRMIFDGRMTKTVGNMNTSISWEGYAGMMSASTPSIYSHFEEVADMGERFIYYRMKDVDERKAMSLALNRKKQGKLLDDTLGQFYKEYIEAVFSFYNNNLSDDDKAMELSEETKERIMDIASFAEKSRTTAKKDWKNENAVKLPISAMPTRVVLQLSCIAKSLLLMKKYEGKDCLDEYDYQVLDWIGYSLTNEENRAILSLLSTTSFDIGMTTPQVSDEIGLNTDSVKSLLQTLASVGVLQRRVAGYDYMWTYKDIHHYNFVRRICDVQGIVKYDNRETILDDGQAHEDYMNNLMNEF